MQRMKLDNEILSAALEGLQAQRANLDRQIAEVRGMMSGKATAASSSDDDQRSEATTSGRKKRRKLSAASRKAMAAGQKKRWAAYRAAQSKKGKAAKAE